MSGPSKTCIDCGKPSDPLKLKSLGPLVYGVREGPARADHRFDGRDHGRLQGAAMMPPHKSDSARGSGPPAQDAGTKRDPRGISGSGAGDAQARPEPRAVSLPQSQLMPCPCGKAWAHTQCAAGEGQPLGTGMYCKRAPNAPGTKVVSRDEHMEWLGNECNELRARNLELLGKQHELVAALREIALDGAANQNGYARQTLEALGLW